MNQSSGDLDRVGLAFALDLLRRCGDERQRRLIQNLVDLGRQTGWESARMSLRDLEEARAELAVMEVHES